MKFPHVSFIKEWRVRYNLAEGTEGAPFRVHPITGELTLVGELDYEAHSQVTGTQTGAQNAARYPACSSQSCIGAHDAVRYAARK